MKTLSWWLMATSILVFSFFIFMMLVYGITDAGGVAYSQQVGG